MSGDKEFEFGLADGRRIVGVIERPQATPRGWAIVAHCFSCGQDGLAAVRLSRALARSGVGVLRFDFAGAGDRDAQVADASFAADVQDLIAASGAMEAAGMTPNLLVGHSLGGLAVLAAAEHLPQVRAIATIGAPADAAHVLTHVSEEDLKRIESEGEAEVTLGGRPYRIGQSFVDDVRTRSPLDAVSRLKRALLVMHAPLDEVVSIDNASAIFVAARHPKSFISLDDADHLLTRQTDADYVAGVIACWASRYLPALEPDLTGDEGNLAGVLVEETGGGAYQARVRVGAHTFLADEPASLGGLGSGPSPFELVSAGLGACSVMTMRMYAERKGWPLERATVRVVHAKRRDQTPADVFKRAITLEGPLDEAQRARLLEMADRCPVDLMLVRGAEVETELLPAA